MKKWLLAGLVGVFAVCTGWTKPMLVLAAVESPDERAEVFFPDLPPMQTDGWGEYESVALLRYQSLREHQQQVFERYANTVRGRNLLLARDFFVAALLPKLAGRAEMQTLSADLPSTPEVILMRLVMADPVKLTDAGQTVRSQSLVVSATDVRGKILFSLPIKRVSAHKGVETNTFEEALFHEAVAAAAEAVCLQLGLTGAEAAEKPTYEVEPVVWDASTARTDVANLVSRALPASTPSLLAGLQPSMAWSANTTSQPLEGTLLGIGTETISGVAVANNSAVLRGMIQDALGSVGISTVVRGAQSDALRAAQGKSIAERELSLTVLFYQESVASSETFTTALPLLLPGSVKMAGLLKVTDRATGDILKSTIVKFELPTEHRLDTLNPATTPFPVMMAMELFAAQAAAEVKALP